MKIARVLALFVFACCGSPLLAQSSSQTPALGLVARSSGGQIGNVAATEGTTVYSGDYLNTSDSGSLFVRIGALSLELEASSGAHIYRAPYGAVVELNHGAAVYSTPGNRENLVIVASDVRVTPALSAPQLGRVSIDDPCNLTVYSQRGQANVQVGSESRVVEQGKTYRVRALYQLNYRKYLSPDDDDYHRYHEHSPCAPLEMSKSTLPIGPGQSHFEIATSAIISGIAIVMIHEALESPDRP
jgi:hypothetical protein